MTSQLEPTQHTPPAPPAGTADPGQPDVFAMLAAQLAIPVHTGAQAQGDLLVQPWTADTAPPDRVAALVDGQPIPVTGIPVLAGRAGHTHVLHAAGPGVTWTARPSTSGLTLGVLTVPPDAIAVLGHEEHADLHIGPGVYALRRQHAQQLPATAPRPQPLAVADPGIDAWTHNLD